MWCLIAFIVTFFITRTITRYIRATANQTGPRKWWQPHNISGKGGTHIHHALVLDEFALILHLQDVYWSEDGRTSVDAVFVAAAVAGLLVLGFNPQSVFNMHLWVDANTDLAKASVIALTVLNLALAVIVLLKGKLWTGLLGMFFTPLVVIGAVRLARPHSPWARWHYQDKPKKMHHSMERERYLRRPFVQANLWLQHVLAGEPRFPSDSEIETELDREVHAAPPPGRPAALTTGS